MKENDPYTLSYENRKKLGTLLLLNPPKKMQFGIDLSQWVIGEKFLGIKLIPFGIHYISFSLSNESMGFKQGFFINITQKNRNIIREWSEKYETFFPLSEELTKNYSIGLDNLDFDLNLGNYPHKQSSNWNDISSLINIDIINNLQKNINMSLTTDINNDEENNEKLLLFSDINYTEINLNQPCLINSIDKSEILEKIFANVKNNNINIVLGEFQYCFILFLIGESYEALKQWKDLFILISSSEKIINKFENFFCKFIEVIYEQLRILPDDLFHDVILENNFLKRYLSNFLLYEIKNCNKFNKRQELLKKFVEEKFGYKILTEEERIIENYLKGIKSYDNNDDINDDLPVVVDEKDLNF